MKFLAVFALSFLISAVAAFDCYQCEYYEGANDTEASCNNDSVPKEFLLPCALPSDPSQVNWQCVKKAGKTVEDEKKYVYRGCSPGKNFDNSCKESSGLDSPYGIIEKAFKCYCAGTECNGAAHFNVTFLLPLIALIGYIFH